MFYQIFFSLEVKQCAIIAYEHSIYKLPQELLNHLILEVSKTHRLIAQCPAPLPKWEFC